MGFLGYIPAQKLSATYLGAFETLSLHAAGEVQDYTSGISFRRDPNWANGLKFDLMGWTGPIGRGKRAYEDTTPFRNQEFVQEVVIQDADGIHKVPVEVTPAAVNASAVQEKSADQLQVLLDVPFEIREGIITLPEGSVTINYDPAFLVLETAGTHNSRTGSQEIVWTFKGIQTGQTKATVLVSGGIATFATSRPIEIEIVALAK